MFLPLKPDVPTRISEAHQNLAQKVTKMCRYLIYKEEMKVLEKILAKFHLKKNRVAPESTTSTWLRSRPIISGLHKNQSHYRRLWECLLPCQVYHCAR
ncbi:hypothetical protein AVEN_8128-1 [Araneus ventricosus]|uniref:Uncharacterized protein n=1 Tax=Araneus ventricosus TaxID=182803 RepID=A0A4Y2THN4_ARAVE|nr:hypothetical protein AVEN_8128-1 [Araneus ventricosus]